MRGCVLFALLAFVPAAAQNIPATMKQCEAGQCMGTWTFNGREGTGRWENGTDAQLSVERYDADGVVIRRTDRSGPTVGLTAIYTGKLQGNRIDGEVTWMWAGHGPQNSGKWSGKWSVTFESERVPAEGRPAQTANDNSRTPVDQVPSAAGPPPGGLPPAMHFCAQHCMTLKLTDDHYVNATRDAGDPDADWGSTWRVERFTSESVILHRVDTTYGRASFESTYKGRIAPEGNRMIDIKSGEGKPTEAQITWGSALNRIPGSDEELRRRFWSNDPGEESGISMPRNAPPPPWIVLPPGASPKFAYFPRDVRAVLQPEVQLTPESIPRDCDVKAPPFKGSANEIDDQAYAALELGKYLIRAANYEAGYCWIKRSAEVGNLRATVIAGVAKMLGIGTEKDEAAALPLFDDAAQYGDVWGTYFGYQCVRQGIGTAVNKAKAQKMSAWLMLNPKGQAVFMSIGHDDLNLRREYERMFALIEPPTKSRRVCESGPRGTVCHTETEIDTEKQREELDAINKKYQN